MTDASWRLRTKSFGAVPVDAVLETAPEVTRGETTDIRVIVERGGLGYPSPFGFTYGNSPTTTPGGGSDHGATWGGSNGGLHGGASTPAVRRYRRLRQYLEYSGQAARGRDIAGDPWYREQIPARATVDSSVLGFDPNSDLGDIDGLWGLVVGGADESTGTGAFVLTFRVFVLGNINDYTDHTAVESNLSA